MRNSISLILAMSLLWTFSPPCLAEFSDGLLAAAEATPASSEAAAFTETKNGMPNLPNGKVPVAIPSPPRSPTARVVVWNPERPTIALALGGGGARGAAHIGVLRVFEREGIPVDYISGSSSGAIVGGLYASGVSLDDIEKTYRDQSIAKAYTPVPTTLKVMTIPPRLLARFVRRKLGLKTDLVGLYSTNNVDKFINSRVSPECKSIENTRIPFAAMTTNLIDGKTYPIESGDLGKAIQASSAVPFYIQPIAWDGKLLVDGGLRANLPTFQARKSQADIVISINVDENMQAINDRTLRSMRGYANRVLSMMLAEIGEHQLEYADLEIRPSIPGVTLYSRSSDDAGRALQAGEEAAMSAIPKIRELMGRKLAMREGRRSKLSDATLPSNAEPDPDVKAGQLAPEPVRTPEEMVPIKRDSVVEPDPDRNAITSP